MKFEKEGSAVKIGWQSINLSGTQKFIEELGMASLMQGDAVVEFDYPEDETLAASSEGGILAPTPPSKMKATCPACRIWKFLPK